ncbi:MAG: hypothetical protein PHE78_03235 [Candidatus Gastranaerophilales bacterium]|nr:hypothetical protein [Candidatus Gastranaerophilales bacterium]
MVDKMKRIFEIYELSENPKEVVIFTKAFKARGILLSDKEKVLDEVITLKDAVVCQPFDKCQCEEHAQYHEWLNIFDKDIIAFSVLS